MKIGGKSLLDNSNSILEDGDILPPYIRTKSSAGYLYRLNEDNKTYTYVNDDGSWKSDVRNNYDYSEFNIKHLPTDSFEEIFNL
jgi:hypothetical protein